MTIKSSPFKADAAATAYIEAADVRLAYRVIGPENGTPLVLAMRFRGVMDEWDPAFLDGLSRSHRIYWFDSSGVGLSSGDVPETIPDMGRVLLDFIEALGLGVVDLLDWSMGGYVVQSAALQRPDLVRRMIVAGSGPGGVPDAPVPPETVWDAALKPVNNDADFLYLFFPQTSDVNRRRRTTPAIFEISIACSDNWPLIIVPIHTLDEDRLALRVTIVHPEAIKVADDIGALGPNLIGMVDRLANAFGRSGFLALPGAQRITMDVRRTGAHDHRLLPGETDGWRVILVMPAEIDDGVRDGDDRRSDRGQAASGDNETMRASSVSRRPSRRFRVAHGSDIRVLRYRSGRGS